MFVIRVYIHFKEQHVYQPLILNTVDLIPVISVLVCLKIHGLQMVLN